MSNMTTASKRPTHLAYSVRDYAKRTETKSDWTKIGIAWAHKDGNGFDIILDALPVNGRVALRKSTPKPTEA